MTSSSLYLMHCQPDPRRLTVWAARHGLLSPQGDWGYALHALMRAAFGDAAPQPFSYQGERTGLLAYSSLSAAELAERAALASPEVAAALGLDVGLDCPGLSARAFPQQWRAGAVLGFEVRVRPVVRGKTGERDVFIAAVEQAKAAGDQPGTDPPLQREPIYARWLAEQLATQGGARLLDATMNRFQLTDVVRRAQPDVDAVRKQRRVGGPDAVFSGHVQIEDPQAFAALVARGVGRHRAFGFGMLLLKPATRLD